MNEKDFIRLATTVGMEAIEPFPDNSGTYGFEVFGLHCLMLLVKDGAEVNSAQFYVGFNYSIGTAEVNTWNEQKRFVKAYRRESDGKLALEMDIVTMGINRDSLVFAFELWKLQLTRAADFF